MKNILGISGFMGSGKSTAAEILKNMQSDSDGIYRSSKCKIVSFADPLKRVVREVIGFPVASLYGPSEERIKPHPISGVTPRLALQTIGQAFRDLDPDVWVRLAIDHVESSTWVYWAIMPDVRYPNEVAAIKKAGGKVIRLKREGVVCSSDHPSEKMMAEMSDSDFDAVVNVPEGVHEFAAELRKVAIQIGWVK